MLNLNTDNFEEKVLKNEKPVLVGFWKQGCNSCLDLMPLIESIEKEVESKAEVGELNILENPEIAKKYKIPGIPALIIFKKGEPKERAVGLRSKQVLIDKLI